MWSNITILILSIVGISDATYLTIKRFTHDSVNCSIFEGCDFVTTSIYSTILGIPVAVLGMVFYISIFVLSILYLRSKNRKILMSLLSLSGVGFLMSMWFVYTQLFILESICSYCMISATLSTTIFILSLIAMIKSKNNNLNINTQYEEIN
jgi:uncharacterized membrane protein